MLESLYIKNFAIIDTLQVDFQSHMTVITGETGAGKSIIIDAIGQLAGERSRLDFIKKGRDKAIIEGIFSIDDDIEELLEEYNIPIENKQLVVSKTINNDGKTTIKMNYKNATQMVLKKIVPHLVDIHSQFETHQLFDPKNHIQILDDYIGEEIILLKKEYKNVYQHFLSSKKEYKSLMEEELSDEQLDFYQAQLDEINEINFDDFDEEHLFNERKRLLDFEKNKQHYTNFNEYINGHNGVLNLLKTSLSELSYIEDNDVKNIYDQLYDIYYSINDYRQEISYIESASDFNEDYFNELQDQYLTYNKLKRKYGQTIEAILNSKEELEKKIDNFKNRDAIITNLKNDINKASDKANKLAIEMSKLRKKQAKELENQILSILKELYLANVQLEFTFHDSELSQNGKDLVVINVSTNIGQELKPLQKIASGGELSRIMLAIKTVCNRFNGIDTIIFDEADTGVSGKVAESIGQVMKNIASHQQVLCITHLAQVASFANHHLYIEKKDDGKNTTVNISELNEKESIQEIAKMISGVNITKESLEHAKNLKKNNA